MEQLILENSLAYHQDVKQSYNSQVYTQRNEIYPHKNLYMNESVHGGTIHKGKKRKNFKVHQLMDKWDIHATDYLKV